MNLESPENFSLKTEAVPEMLVFKVRPILQTSQKRVTKVTKWPLFFFSYRLFIFSGFIVLNKMMQIN